MEGKSTLSSFVLWWYVGNRIRLLAFCRNFFVYLFDFFSVEICLRTLFDVWKRDRIDYHHLSLPQIFQAWVLNLASRFAGFFVKIFTLLTYVVVSTLFLAAAMAALVVWLFYPIVTVGLLVYGFILIGGRL